MAKFCRLVKNEYIKVFTKVSTLVLLILVVLFSLGFTSIMKIGEVISEKNYNSYYSSLSTDEMLDNYRSNIEYLKQEQAEGYEAEVAYYEFLIDQKIRYEDWRDRYVHSTMQEKWSIEQRMQAGEFDEATYNKRLKDCENQLQMLKDNNWKGYYTLLVNSYQSNGSLTAAEREANIFRYQYALDHDLDPSKNDWRDDLAAEIAGTKQQLLNYGDDGQLSAEDLEAKNKLQESLLLMEYRLEHNLESVPKLASLNSLNTIDFWSVLGISTFLIGVVSMVIIIIAGGSIANEFSNGTIKFLLINPVSRWKIFLSKYTMILTLSVLLVLGFLFTNVLFTGLMFGFGNILNPYLYVVDGAVHELPGMLFLLWQYLIGSVNLLVMGTLAFAISSLMRNSAVAIGISVFLMLGGNAVVSFLGALGMDWARFFIFANTDLNAVMTGTSIFQEMTVGFSLTVIAVHMVVLFLTAWDGFMRRESI